MQLAFSLFRRLCSVCLFTVALLFLGLLPTRVFAANCDAVGAEPAFRTNAKKAKLAHQKLQRFWRNTGVYLFDLNAEGWASYHRIEDATVGKDWCVVVLEAKSLRTKLRAVAIDEVFIGAKKERISKLLTDLPPGKESRAKKLMKKAARQEGRGKWGAENKTLNEVLRMIVGLKQPWSMPPKIEAAVTEVGMDADAEDALERAQLSDEEIEESCPELASQSVIESEDFKAIARRLQSTMNDRKIRTLDFGRRQALFEKMKDDYLKRDFQSATRLACGLLSRAKKLPIDLGMVAGRNHLVGKWKRAREHAMEDEAFFELVRNTGKELSTGEYKAAHAHLEILFIALGEPVEPGDFLSFIEEDAE